jgi:GH18 family chitinase
MEGVQPAAAPDSSHRSGLATGAVAALALLAAGCATDMTAQDAEGEAPTFRIIGYVTDTGLQISDEQLEQLTHVNYAFALPNHDGSLRELANPWKLADYVERAHARGIAVLISVGGWGPDPEFEALAADLASRARFVAAVTSLVDEFGLDGADIDWEYPDPGASAEAFLALMSELRSALGNDSLLTAAVAAVSPSADGVLPDVFDTVDFLNVMAYDGGEPAHSPMSYAEEALDHWADLGLTPEQTVLGVPFYSRPAEVSYRELVETDLAAAEVDEFDWHGSPQNYNGLATIRAKTDLALRRASGIMIWTVADDTTDDTSLLRVIRETIGDR